VQDASAQLQRRWASVREPAAYLRIAVATGAGPGAGGEVLRAGKGSNDDPGRYSKGGALAVPAALRSLLPRQREIHAQIVCTYWHGAQG
jgi:hypothetical protein